MSENRRQDGEGQGGSGKKRNGRPRWFHKRNKNKAGQNNGSQKNQQQEPNPRQTGDNRSRQQGNQKKPQVHGPRSGEIQGMPMQMIDGKLRRRDRLVSIFNIQQVLDKSLSDSRKEIARIKQDKKVCALCSTPIDDMLSAVRHSEGDDVCHFECVQKELAKSEPLAENEKMVYVGNGDFCIVQERRNRGKMYYFLRKRIHWRDAEKNRKS